MSENFNSLASQFYDSGETLRPDARTWFKHSILLALAFVTVTVAGTLQPFGIIPIFPDQNPQTTEEIIRFFMSFPYLYLHMIGSTLTQLADDPQKLFFGLKFSLSLLSILTAHEAGHYVACRLYRVDATLPYFIPTPPLVGPAGTLGAFIKILSPLPSRRATFDIGVAGPIAGFLVIIPVAVIAFLTMQTNPASAASVSEEIHFAPPLLLQILASVFQFDLSAAFAPNPFYNAAWIGLLVTSLNLIPSGQLDGGHAVFAVFGRRIHQWTGRVSFAAMATLSVLGFVYFNSPSGLLFTVLLGIMMRIRHPEPYDDQPLDFPRLLVAVLTLVIFVLCFVPFPIQIR